MDVTDYIDEHRTRNTSRHLEMKRVMLGAEFIYRWGSLESFIIIWRTGALSDNDMKCLSDAFLAQRRQLSFRVSDDRTET